MTEPALTRVSGVRAKRLFGLYDHSIELKLDDRVTIIHGPNGVGKTMMLRLIAAMFSGRLIEFTRVPFESFQVNLSDGTEIILAPAGSRKPSEKAKGFATAALRLTVNRPDGMHNQEELDFSFRENADWTRLLQLEVPGLERIEEDRWYDRRNGRSLTTFEALSLYSELIPPSFRAQRAMLGEPDWFGQTRTQVNVHLIETQRLLRVTPTESASTRRANSTMVPTVRDYAQDLKRRVIETLANYARESQALDQSFPQRLLRSPDTELSIENIKERLTELDDKRAKLKNIGLLDDNAAYPFDTASLDNLDRTQRSVMTLYVQDTAKKLGELDDLKRRVELLRDNVNAKFKHKSIRFDRDRGFTAVGHDGGPLDLDALSSGEQHELVLLYDLLFRVEPNTLVLIDEPELSLHVLWQKRFLPDLLEIVQTAQFDALVATHSPFIVGDRADLMVPLAAEPE